MSGSGMTTEPGIAAVREFADGVEIDLSLPDDLFYFQGHFPKRPILPGVVQVDWAVRLADRYLETSIGSAQNFRVKFSSIIEPGRLITIVLRHSMNRERVSFEYRDNTNTLSSGSIHLESGS